MSFLTLEFAILFLKVLNIDFLLILISLNVAERLLLLQMTYPCFISLLYLDLYVLGDDALIS